MRERSDSSASDLRRLARSMHSLTTNLYGQVENCASPRNWLILVISFRNTCCVTSPATARSPWKKWRETGSDDLCADLAIAQIDHQLMRRVPPDFLPLA